MSRRPPPLLWHQARPLGVLARYGLELHRVAPAAGIPGSFWGDSEAGLIGARIFARPDTPLHSLLHEAGHYVCMGAARRARLHTDAGGDPLEEAAVCFLQVLLAAPAGATRRRMFSDMDRWGYSFRLGRTAAWFRYDADDARAWLCGHGVLDGRGRVTWRLRP